MTTHRAPVRSDPFTQGRAIVIAASQDYLPACEKSVNRLRNSKKYQLFSLQQNKPARKTQPQPALLVSGLEHLRKEDLLRARVGPATQQIVFLGELPVAAVATRLLPFNIRNPERIHIADLQNIDEIEGLLYRVISGLTDSRENPRIVDAWIEQQTLVLLSPAFVRMQIPLEKLARYLGAQSHELETFEIDEDGRFLYWPHADVHLGWSQFEQILDPAKLVTAASKTRQYNQRYGSAIRALREEHGLRQTDIPGLTERQIRRMEQGQQSATKSALEALSQAHRLTLSEYTQQLAKRVSTS